MKKEKTFYPEFLKYIPNDIDDSKLYISLEFGCAIFMCPCGCGHKAVLSLRPFWEDAWDIEINEDKVSFSPSILSGVCKSHFYIKNNKVEWA